jgi:hypothetical protein
VLPMLSRQTIRGHQHAEQLCETKGPRALYNLLSLAPGLEEHLDLLHPYRPISGHMSSDTKI